METKWLLIQLIKIQAILLEKRKTDITDKTKNHNIQVVSDVISK